MLLAATTCTSMFCAHVRTDTLCPPPSSRMARKATQNCLAPNLTAEDVQPLAHALGYWMPDPAAPSFTFEQNLEFWGHEWDKVCGAGGGQRPRWACSPVCSNVCGSCEQQAAELLLATPWAADEEQCSLTARRRPLNTRSTVAAAATTAAGRTTQLSSRSQRRWHPG